MSRLKLDPHLLILLALAALLVAPLTAPGYFIYAHDARHTVYFYQMFDAALRDGALYPRWAADMTFGYGYPVWIILAPLPYYLGELFHLLGLDFVSAVKAVDALALVGSGAAMYLLASRVLGKDAGLVAAVAYLFIPYHVVDLYVRAAQAEFVAYIFPPLILWALYEMMTRQRTPPGAAGPPRLPAGFFAPLAALAFAGLILTHAQTAALFSPLIGAYILMLWLTPHPGPLPSGEREMGNRGRGGGAPPRPLFPEPLPPLPANGEGLGRGTEGIANVPGGKRRVRELALPAAAIALGVLLSATFTLPVLVEQRYLTADPLIGGFFNFRQHFISLSQLLSPFWGYGYAGINGGDQFSLQLGVLPLLLAFAGLVGAWRDPDRSVWGHVILCALASLAVILLVLPFSEPLWNLAAPVVAYVQFPWRLLMVTTVTLALLCGAALRVLPATGGRLQAGDAFPAAVLLSLLLALAMFPNARPQYTDAPFDYNTMMDFEVQDGELLGDTIWMQGARPTDSPLVAQYRAGQITQKATIVEGTGSVVTLAHHSQWDELRVTADQPVRVLFYTRYFPGWTATIDGSPARDVGPYGDQGLLAVQVPAGSHVVRAGFGDTPVRQIGAALSLAGLIGALAWLGLAFVCKRGNLC